MSLKIVFRVQIKLLLNWLLCPYNVSDFTYFYCFNLINQVSFYYLGAIKM